MVAALFEQQPAGGGQHGKILTRGRWVGVFCLLNFNKYYGTKWVVSSESKLFLQSTEVLIGWYDFLSTKILKVYIYFKEHKMFFFTKIW